MRASIRASCLMGWLTFGACVRAQTPASSASEGSSVFTVVVSNAETSEPLAGARVQLRGIGSLAGNGRTDEKGRLSIAGLAPGGYFAAASKPGFLNKESHGVAVSAGDAPRELRIALTPAGAITGRVLDEEGNPVEHAGVVVVPAFDGIRFGSPAMTDAEGRFRISGLSPGEYRVRAESPETGPPETRTDGTKEVHYAPTYYGETLRVAGSSRVQVRPGTDTGAIEIKLIASPMVSISGRVIGFPAVERQLGVVLRYIGEHLLEKTAGGWYDSGREAVFLPNGSFRFWRVDPGAYSVEARDGSLRVYSQRVDVEVAGRDIENVELQYAAPIAIDGRIEYLDEGALWGEYQGPPGKRPMITDIGPATTPPPTQLVLRLVEDGINDYKVYVNAKDGRFRIPDLRPGRYRVESHYSYAQSVRLGALMSGGNVIDVRPGMGGQTLVVALSSGFASVAGVVRDAKGPVAGTVVYLLPENGDPLAWMSRVQTREDGSYSFSSVMPGRYRLVAVEADDSAARAGLGLEEYASAADWLDLHEREDLRRDLRVGAR
jgi:hypothetical protein